MVCYYCNMTNKIINFFDKLEDKIRGKLSHYPLVYAFLGGIGMVLFWRGVWHTADFLSAVVLSNEPFTFESLLDGPLSLVIGGGMLLITGVFVSGFIGSRLIISGLSGEKKLAEKTKEEVITEEDQIRGLKKSMDKIGDEIVKIESEIKKHHSDK